MRVLITCALTIFLASCHGQSSDECKLDREALMKTAMECLSHDPSLMVQIIERMEHPDEMANMKFVCRNQKDILDVAMCMEKKMVKCLPTEVQTIVSSLVDRSRLEAGLSLACQHQTELLSKCMDEKAQMGFAGCINKNVQELLSSLGSSMGMEGWTCRYTDIFKSCLASHRGQCSESYLDLYAEVFEMALPEHHCDSKSLAQFRNGPASKLLGALMVHDQPLLSLPLNKLGSVYKMGQN